MWEVKIKVKLEDERDKFGVEDIIINALNAANVPFFSIDWRQVD